MADASKNRVPNFAGRMVGPSARDHILVNLGYPFSTRRGGCLLPPNPSAVPGGWGHTAGLRRAPFSPCARLRGKSHILASFPDTC